MSNKNDGKLVAAESREGGKLYFCCEKPMAPPPHVQLAESKIRPVFGVKRERNTAVDTPLWAAGVGGGEGSGGVYGLAS